MPDKTLFLSVPLEFIKKNLSETRTGEDRDYLNGKEDIHEKSITLQENVYKEYVKLLESREDFGKVDCFDEEGRFLPKEQIHEKIWKLLSE
jgi:dTMP kinase